MARIVVWAGVIVLWAVFIFRMGVLAAQKGWV